MRKDILWQFNQVARATLYLMRRNYFRPIQPAFVKDVYEFELSIFEHFCPHSGKIKKLSICSYIFSIVSI